MATNESRLSFSTKTCTSSQREIPRPRSECQSFQRAFGHIEVVKTQMFSRSIENIPKLVQNLRKSESMTESFSIGSSDISSNYKARQSIETFLTRFIFQDSNRNLRSNCTLYFNLSVYWCLNFNSNWNGNSNFHTLFSDTLVLLAVSTKVGKLNGPEK